MYTQSSNTEIYIYDIDGQVFTNFYLSDYNHYYKSLATAHDLFHFGGNDGNFSTYCLTNTVYYLDANNGLTTLTARVEVNTTHGLSSGANLATVNAGTLASSNCKKI